jgi:hypothetical protein
VVTDFEIVEVIPAMRRCCISLNVEEIGVRLLAQRIVWEMGIGKGKGERMRGRRRGNEIMKIGDLDLLFFCA